MGRLSERFPALYSHATAPGASVRSAVQGELPLVPRLTAQATTELSELQGIIQHVRLTEVSDSRICTLAGRDNVLRSSPVYHLAASALHDSDSLHYSFVWRNRAPPRVQFFGWLLVQERIQCKASLEKKGIVEDATWDICRRTAETADHLISQCSFVRQFWNMLKLDATSMKVAQIWQTARPDNVPSLHYDCFLLLCCWNIWKHRHDVVFRSMEPSLHRLLIACLDDARSWSCRLRREEKKVTESWCQIFPPCNTAEA
ncbi:hypothetical protein BAE44_0002732 [Dichanthelium oligosanthes]|uniref:Reverse transcriptase zinc-binding domain-containing protein n=1 Tax=Dichanthelium oligosanthes TaxID=888268 RepID=A0A1E5WFQ7_9POAL|nr:hypothetical protein BAE44_0002732 [Dichanthelium oligosanthes]